MSLLSLPIRKMRLIRMRGGFNTRQTGPMGAGQSIVKSKRFRLLCTLCPIIAMETERDDPLFGFPVGHHRLEPTLKPIQGGNRPRGIKLPRLVVQHHHHPIRLLTQSIEIKYLQLATDREDDPELQSFRMKRDPQSSKKSSQGIFQGRLDLAPIHHHPMGSHIPGLPHQRIDQFRLITSTHT